MNIIQAFSSQTNTASSTPRRISSNIPIYLLFFFLLLSCYQNSFQASWHFDDIPNIVLNTPLHINDLSLASLKQTFFAYPDLSGKLLRPVTNLTFALNWYFHQDRVFGYHVVNFFIHFLTTICLYHTCLLLLNTPILNNKYKSNCIFIAALTAILWAVNPIQTQAITYIVQRMASLATLFFISGIWSYLKARSLPSANLQSTSFYLLTCLFFFLAIGSKENAVIFPAAIILVELIFLQKSFRYTRKNAVFITAGLALILFGTLLLVGPKFFIGIFNAYETRDFTLWQRLLTEARIVVFYISLLFYPSPLRLSITHDIQLSSSLFSPITTLPAVLILILLTILPFFLHKRYPLISFAILFFLLNHIIESTFIPLELLFEHRNFLPSLFLFLPLATAINTLIQKYRTSSQMLYFTMVAATTVIIILLSLGTIIRNSVWTTERSLWTDSLEKAPQSARSYINLAHSYLYQDKNYRKAFQLSYTSLDKKSPTPWKDRLRAYNIMGNTMTHIGNHEQAFIFYDKALSSATPDPDSTLGLETLFLKGKAQWLAGQTTLAIQTITELVNTAPEKNHYLQLNGEMLVAVGKKIEGVTLLARALNYSNKKNKEYSMTILDLSVGYGQMGNLQKAVFFQNVAELHNPATLPFNLCLLENSIRTNEPVKAEYALKLLLSQLTLPGLLTALKGPSPEHPTIPLDYSLLHQYILNWLAEQRKS